MLWSLIVGTLVVVAAAIVVGGAVVVVREALSPQVVHGHREGDPCNSSCYLNRPTTGLTKGR